MVIKKISGLIKKYSGPSNIGLIRNIVLVGGIAFLVKIASFYKETVIASEIGLSELLDTFFLALIVPTFVQQVFINSLKNLFVPNYITEQTNGENIKSFQSLAFLLVIGLAIALSILSLVFIEFFLYYVFPNHEETYYDLIKMQFYYVLPCLFFWGLTNFMAGLIEIANKFLVTSISAIFPAITTIFCLKFFSDVLKEKVLSVGLLSGCILSFLFILFFALKYKVLHLGKPKFSENSRMMIKQFPPKVSSGLLSGLNNFVDQFFAAQLVVGSIAALNYGKKIPAFLVGILILALGNVLLPHFSKLTNQNMVKAFKQLFKILKVLFIVTLFAAIFLILGSYEIIALLFERNEFTSEDTLIVADIQKIALIYVPFYLCTLVTVKFLTAINKNVFMAWASLWNLILNLVLNYIFIKLYGLYGLMLSTTCVYILNSFIYVGFTIGQYRLHLKNE
ncbi:murein biosynthesis integral membrane protein MurJ [Flagellimonas zhangzhouensis]|uniref:Putative peptidoglycan lipid II flippase n=1 Tax=Flagellimonas zhangzhouensis TaxID=1073328 RepID=A0A1H2YRH8_9FLAO|nr:lipid II flippase MurJ [Allomuricauda zhangzhouensis]SDR00189.1 putative peptidoglycan lipid II flippase [Allomuricauda zhangzhouensis]SDX07625.1 putative peptidoglycan lipid II flippase [Allomuricauda zhangzhouensis]